MRNENIKLIGRIKLIGQISVLSVMNPRWRRSMENVESNNANPATGLGLVALFRTKA